MKFDESLYPLIIGLGEIGSPLYEIVKSVYPKADWLDIEPKKVRDDPAIIHVAFPCNDQKKFVSAVKQYLSRFKPELVIIESTAPPGTTNKIKEVVSRKFMLVHSPLRGNVNEGVKKGLLGYTKYIGPIDKESGETAREYYTTLGIRTFICDSPRETELAKLWETTYKAVMISVFQEIARNCRRIDANYDQVTNFLKSTEDESKNIFGYVHTRPIMYPGYIGGHCIIPNAKLLHSKFRSKLIESVLESNEKRKRELEESEPKLQTLKKQTSKKLEG